jgi:hypothetical protein
MVAAKFVVGNCRVPTKLSNRLRSLASESSKQAYGEQAGDSKTEDYGLPRQCNSMGARERSSSPAGKPRANASG